jgi:hypothetical protein
MKQGKEMVVATTLRKLPYRPPRLTKFGTIGQLTGFSHNTPHSQADGGLGSLRKTS